MALAFANRRRRMVFGSRSLVALATLGLLPALVCGEANAPAVTADITMSSGRVYPSGTTIRVLLSGAATALQPAYGATGLTVQARPGRRGAWQNEALAGQVGIAGNSAAFGLQNAIPAGWQTRLIYNASTGGITDSAQPTPLMVKAVNGLALTNNSAYVPTAAPVVNTAASTGDKIFLATRGFARTSVDPHNVNKEAETLHRQEMPYGAAPGWAIPYQGFSDGSTDSIIIKGAAAWIQQSPGEPTFREPLSFGGAPGTTLAANALVPCDPLSTPLLPGAIVWVTTWYKCGLAATGLPYQTFIYTRESTLGAEDRDGTLSGDIGTLADHTMSGGFDHSALGQLTAGQPYCARGFAPMAIVGKPNPVFHGKLIVPLFLGDSINVQQNDFSDDNTLYSMRGFNGRFCASRYPYMVFGQGGSNSGGFTGAVGTPLFNYIFGTDGTHDCKVTHAVNEYGINSMRVHTPVGDVANMEWQDRQRVAAILLANNIPYIQTTITPCEQGWTNWPTDKGGPNDAAYATFVAQRQQFNNMVRTQSGTIAGCIGFVDPCPTLETDAKNGSNLWLPAYKSDGIHPDSAGHQAYADSIDGKLFTDKPSVATAR